ncbi:MAG: glycosyltransferase family 2 protein [Endomicrobium sp.]|jgi:glycosyltransferase involved in cell wall biosynthesis|nr:glycosyltransferase family 2 protein [Endomicrobium sp.]
MDSEDLSIIAPMYNEQEVIEVFFSEIFKVLNKLKEYSFEIICVNDGSTDDTLRILKEFAQKDKRIKIISFSRNFGKEKAMYAALEACCGKAAVIIDVDLQDPAELIVEFINKWKEGYDNVYGVRSDRQTDTFLKRVTANYFYDLVNKISDSPIHKNTGDFRLIDRKIIDGIKQIHDKKLFMKYIFNWPGYKSVGIEYVRQKRAAGKTKFNYWKLWNFALDGISSSSTLPLRIWTYLGMVIAFISFVYGGYIVFRTVIHGVDVPGYASTFIAVLFFGGVQLICLGVIGEYLGRLLEETRNRPLYIVGEKINF